ncbi:MAG: PSP1 C-terminal domain-containing protein [Faecalibacterium prausnitzii]
MDVRWMRQNREDEKRVTTPARSASRPPRAGNEAGGGAEYTSTASNIMFYFTADGRVDFRELVINGPASSPHSASSCAVIGVCATRAR